MVGINTKVGHENFLI